MARQKLPYMLERIRRCRRCGVEVDRPSLEYEETPYCANCLSESVKETGSANASWQRNGQYLEVTQSARRHH
jgi:hypothetical protein